jgi:hypothetical protein
MAQAKSHMVRISASSHEALYDIASKEGKSMASVLEDAVEQYRREYFFHSVNAAYARLRKQPEAWKEYVREIEEWDATLLDGLEED